MAIIKAPPKQPKSVTIQARVEESVKAQLDHRVRIRFADKGVTDGLMRETTA